jgi:uncharacterized membrane protein
VPPVPSPGSGSTAHAIAPEASSAAAARQSGAKAMLQHIAGPRSGPYWLSRLRGTTAQRTLQTVERLWALTVLALVTAAAPGCAGSERPDPPPDAALGDDCPNDLPDNAACATRGPSYAEQTAAIIEQRCTICHFAGNTQSTQVFETYAEIFDQRRGMLTQIYSCRMPPEASAQLMSGERSALLQWLVCGAPDN